MIVFEKKTTLLNLSFMTTDFNFFQEDKFMNAVLNNLNVKK